MTMNIYSDKEQYESSTDPWVVPCYWVAGIGSLGEPFNPVYTAYVGGGYTLQRVSRGDKVIYTSQYAADVEEIAETEPGVIINHGEIYIEGAATAQLYDLDGRSYNAANGRFYNLAKGVYILRRGDKTRKIFVP